MARPTCGRAQVAAHGGMAVKDRSRNAAVLRTGLGDAIQVTSVMSSGMARAWMEWAVIASSARTFARGAQAEGFESVKRIYSYRRALERIPTPCAGFRADVEFVFAEACANSCSG
jgi:hypothetical protein